MSIIIVPGTATADKVLTGYTFSAGALYDAPGTLLPGKSFASGSATVANGQITVTGLAFMPDIILTSYYYSSGGVAYQRVIGWSWNSSDQKRIMAVAGQSPNTTFDWIVAPGDLTPNSSGFSGYVGIAGSSGTCSWRAYGA